MGLVNDTLRSAQRLVEEMTDVFPAYKIWPEKYSGYYEIEIEKNVAFVSVAALHEKVVAMATVIEQGYAIGRELLGTEIFHR